MGQDIKFGTDGWRALIGKDFTTENVEIVSQAFSKYVGQVQRPVVVGFDNRFGSEDFALTAAKVLSSNGQKVLLSRSSCPSQLVSFHVKLNSSPAGIMITASHNPPQWNGFKVKGSYGGSATPEITKQIEDNIEGANNYSHVRAKDFSPQPSLISYFDPKPPYYAHIKTLVDLDLIKRSGIKIIVDPMFGSGTGYIPDILSGIIKVEEINNKRDTSFGGINPEPIAPNLAKLMSICKEKKTVGLALDGDADRIGAVGSDGIFINTHQIFALLLHHLFKNKKWTGLVVKTFNLTKLIDMMCKRYGLELHETPIGFKYICDIMLKEDVLLGGEESGGMGIKNHLPERDGILAALLLTELMAFEKKTLNEVLDDISKDFKRFYYNRLDLRLEEERKQKTVALLKDHPPATFAGMKITDIQRMDGTKLYLEDGSWILFRASGTEPLLRIYCESGSQQQVESLLKEAKELVG